MQKKGKDHKNRGEADITFQTARSERHSFSLRRSLLLAVVLTGSPPRFAGRRRSHPDAERISRVGYRLLEHASVPSPIAWLSTCRPSSSAEVVAKSSF